VVGASVVKESGSRLRAANAAAETQFVSLRKKLTKKSQQRRLAKHSNHRYKNELP